MFFHQIALPCPIRGAQWDDFKLGQIFEEFIEFHLNSALLATPRSHNSALRATPRSQSSTEMQVPRSHFAVFQKFKPLKRQSLKKIA